MKEYEKQLAHLVRMAGNQATKAHAWHRSKELERCETGMWNGISEALVQAMRIESSKQQQSSGG